MSKYCRQAMFGVVVVVGAIAISVVGSHGARAGKKAPAKITIDGCKDKKPPVVFEHKKHQDWVKQIGKDCKTCHHKGSATDGPTGKQKLCSDCHSKPVEAKVNKNLGTCKDKSKKKNPFHVRCIGCHKELKGKPDLKLTKGPTKCKQCHKK